jgi:hypothetical protein
VWHAPSPYSFSANEPRPGRATRIAGSGEQRRRHSPIGRSRPALAGWRGRPRGGER